MFRKIQWRIAIPYVVLISICMGVISLYLVNFVRQSETSALEGQLLTQARLVGRAASPYFLPMPDREALNSLARRIDGEAGVRITIISLDGTVLADSQEDPASMENHANRPEIEAALTTGGGTSHRYSTTKRQNMLYAAAPIPGADSSVFGVARLAVPATVVEASLVHIVTVITLAAGIVTMLAVAAAVGIAHGIAQPVKAITQAARRIASGNLGHRIHIDASEELEQLAGAFNDMTAALKDNIGEISRERNRLSAIISQMFSGLIMTNDAGLITLANDAAGGLFSFDPQTVLNRPFIEAVRDHEIDQLLQRCLKEGMEQSLQLEMGLERRFVRVAALPFTEDERKAALVLVQDVTELRRLERVRREFVSNISHELRTPLASIKAMAEALELGAMSDPEVGGGFLRNIELEADKMAQMVDELMELSRLERGQRDFQFQAVDVRQVITEAVERLRLQAQQQNVNLVVEPMPDPLRAKADAQRVQQVLVNLIHNAIKFTPAGGTVRILSMVHDQEVLASVQDNGIGIAEEDLPHIFERFYKADRSRASEGTGLGLAIAKHVVQAHGGRIWVESVEGKGSTFSFTLLRV